MCSMKKQSNLSGKNPVVNSGHKSRSFRSERNEEIVSVSDTSVSDGRKPHSVHKTENLVASDAARNTNNSISSINNSNSVTSTKTKNNGSKTVAKCRNSQKKKHTSSGTRKQQHPQKKKHTSSGTRKQPRSEDGFKKSHRTINSVVNQFNKLLEKHIKKESTAKDVGDNFCRTCGYMKSFGAGKMDLIGSDGKIYTIQRGSTASQLVSILAVSSIDVQHEIAFALKAALNLALGVVMTHLKRDTWIERNRKTVLFKLERYDENSNVIVDDCIDGISTENLYDILKFIIRQKSAMLKNCAAMFDTITPIFVDKTKTRSSFNSIVYRLLAEILEIGANNVDFNSLSWCGFSSLEPADLFFPKKRYALPSKKDLVRLIGKELIDNKTTTVDKSQDAKKKQTSHAKKKQTSHATCISPNMFDIFAFPVLNTNDQESLDQEPSDQDSDDDDMISNNSFSALAHNNTRIVENNRRIVEKERWAQVVAVQSKEDASNLAAMNQMAINEKIQNLKNHQSDRLEKNSTYHSQNDHADRLMDAFVEEMSRNEFDKDHVIDEDVVMDVATQKVINDQLEEEWSTQLEEEELYASDHDEESGEDVASDWENEI